MFTIRVLIETIKPQNCLTCSNEGQTILDTFVVVNGQTAFSKLVESVLKDLGMPHLVSESKGLIQINNWKPLSFDQITDNLFQPITNLLKDISSNLTLKILTRKIPSTIKAPNPIVSNGIIKTNKINSCNANDNGTGIIQMPLPEPDGILITENASESSPSFFGHENVSENSISDSDNDIKESATTTESSNDFHYSTSLTKTETSLSPSNSSNNNNLPTSFFSEFTNNFLNLPSTITSNSSSRNNTLNNSSIILRDESSLNSKYSNFHGSGRSRLMFDLMTEIPMLEQWFQENSHPNWMQIEGYTNTLNELPYRQNSGSPMTTLNIKIWFKNRRARSKKLINN